jgi:hypothetical protein
MSGESQNRLKGSPACGGPIGLEEYRFNTIAELWLNILGVCFVYARIFYC